MDKKELKQVIKEMVRESLMEIFAEMKLESIVEGVVQKQVRQAPAKPRPTPKRSVAEVFDKGNLPEAGAPTMTKEEMRRNMMDKIGVDEATWANIYEDTADSDNPVLAGDDAGKPEFVPEGRLRQSGLYKDYSKFVK